MDRVDTQGPALTLPHVPGVSEVVKCILTPLGAKVSFWPHSTLRQLLVRPKDRVPEKEQTDVIYQVSCAGCPPTYVGQTSRCLDQRLFKHRQVVESGQVATSALAEHAWGAHHPVDWDNIKVLDYQPDLHQKSVLESIYIRSQPRPQNRNKGSIPHVYNSLETKGQFLTFTIHYFLSRSTIPD